MKEGRPPLALGLQELVCISYMCTLYIIILLYQLWLFHLGNPPPTSSFPKSQINETLGLTIPSFSAPPPPTKESTLLIKTIPLSPPSSTSTSDEHVQLC